MGPPRRFLARARVYAHAASDADAPREQYGRVHEESDYRGYAVYWVLRWKSRWSAVLS